MKTLKFLGAGIKEAFLEETRNIKASVAATLLISIGIIIAFYVGLFIGSQGTLAVTDYLKLILSWPTLGFIGLVIFMAKFQDSIAQFLSEHSVAKLGMIEMGKKQKQAEEEPPASPKREDTSTVVDEGERPSESEPPEGSELERVKAELQEMKSFKDLDAFLVDKTKKVLLWFYTITYGKTPITKPIYDLNYQVFIPDPSQREIIFDVLEKNGMIVSKDGNNYTATEKAERFLKYAKLVE
jgi:predicted transcriptional regulator